MQPATEHNARGLPSRFKTWQMLLLGIGWWAAALAGDALSAAIRDQRADLTWSALVAAFLSTAAALPLLGLLFQRLLGRRDTLPQVLAILAVALFRQVWAVLLLWAFPK